jgi:hypothetical protein
VPSADRVVVDCRLGQVAAGGTASVGVTGTVAAPTGTSQQVVAQARSATLDPVPADNVATATIVTWPRASGRLGVVDRDRRTAAANNAGWCDLVCRSHGLDPALDRDAWTSRMRTPPLYPDAVTLAGDVSVPGLLARVDAAAGCSIKDSFASLDLSAVGFRVLFEAEWIVRPPSATSSAAAPAGVAAWEVVRAPDVFVAWERAWRGDDGPVGVLRADLLGHPSVTVLAARDGDRVSAGAVLYRGAGVVGVSNMFTDPDRGRAGWVGCLALVDAVVPGATVVGYEAGDALAAALSAGFRTAGPLRVWSR